MLSIIIVNYRNEQKTIKYIRTELKKIITSHIVIVVNNAATEESNKTLSNSLDADIIYDINQPINREKRHFIVANSNNLGFAKGNNLGAEFSLIHFNITHFLFSNNDIRFIHADVVERLIEKINQLPEIALIGPKVVGIHGEYQSPEPFMSFWDRYVWMYWITPFLSKKNKIKRFNLDYSDNAKEGSHYKIMGSFFIVKAQDFINCGMMDPNTFLYAEEKILTERLKKIGKSVYYYPSVTILHEHGQTIKKYHNSISMSLMQFGSECYYYKKYRNVSRLSIIIGKISFKLYVKIKSK